MIVSCKHMLPRDLINLDLEIHHQNVASHIKNKISNYITLCNVWEK